MISRTPSSNLGAVASARGTIAFMRFDAHLPTICSLQHANEGELAMAVSALLDAHYVRGFALTSTQDVALGIVEVST